MDESTQSPNPGEDLLEMVLRRIEEDGRSAHATMVSDLHKRPTELRQRVMGYLVELFEISAYWNNFLVQNYQVVDSYYKPHLEKLTEQVVSHGEHLIAKWDVLDKPTFIRTLKSQLAGKRSHWTAEALKRARDFSSYKHPPEKVPDRDSGATATNRPNELPRQTKPRRNPEPNLQLLDKGETLNRKQAAEALGVSERTLDRWVVDGTLTPIGPGVRKRLKTRELRKLLNQRSQDKVDKSRQD